MTKRAVKHIKITTLQKLLNDIRKQRREFIKGRTFYKGSEAISYIGGLDFAIAQIKFHIAVYKNTDDIA